MAIDVKKILSDALLSLCEKKPLQAIRVSDLLEESSVSRQTFYNHFRDKNNLIAYIYRTRVLVSWDENDPDSSYHHNMLHYYKRAENHLSFLRQACSIIEQNCLREFMLSYTVDYWIHWFQNKLETETLPTDIAITVFYSASGIIHLIIEWILGQFRVPAEEIAKETCLLQLRSFYPLFLKYKTDVTVLTEHLPEEIRAALFSGSGID